LQTWSLEANFLLIQKKKEDFLQKVVLFHEKTHQCLEEAKHCMDEIV